jgi:hypothetical protein
MSPTRQRPFKVRTTRDCLIVFMVQPVLPADETLSAALRGVWFSHTAPSLRGTAPANGEQAYAIALAAWRAKLSQLGEQKRTRRGKFYAARRFHQSAEGRTDFDVTAPNPHVTQKPDDGRSGNTALSKPCRPFCRPALFSGHRSENDLGRPGYSLPASKPVAPNFARDESTCRTWIIVRSSRRR